MDTLKQSIILFDLDGTLTDSEEGIIRSTQYMQEKMGTAHLVCGGAAFYRRAAADCSPLRREFGMAQEMAEKAVAIFRERYATIGLFENSVFPGVVELLQALRKRGNALPLQPRKKRTWAVRILEHFEIADYLRSSAVTGERSAGTIRRRSLIMCWRPCRRRKTMSS
mgnify:CR=1 FL=1